MVFGNMGDDCGTGVAFTRDPPPARTSIYGEYLINAQGEDVVAGVRTPQPIEPAGRARIPTIHEQFMEIAKTLEQHYKDMQDMEFTIERGKLFMLQTPLRQAHRPRRGQHRRRPGERRPDRPRAGPDPRRPRQPEPVAGPALDPRPVEGPQPMAKGLNAGPGAAAGHVALIAEQAEAHGRSRQP